MGKETIMKLSEHDLRALGSIHRGAGVPKLSNFDNTEKRLARLKVAGMVADDGKLTDMGRSNLRGYYLDQGWDEMAGKV